MSQEGGVFPQERGWLARVWSWLMGAPRNLLDRGVFHKMSLIPLLAWVGMGADGLSSSAYGPEESFKALQGHLYMAPLVILASVLTITIISMAYSRVIEHFPHGGGGYVVASRLLGPWPGAVSGCSLVVDYVLTISVSIAAGGDALFSILPPAWQTVRIPTEATAIALLTLMNIRGVKESVVSIAPVFFAFIATHALLIVGVFFLHRGDVAGVAEESVSGCFEGLGILGFLGLGAVFLRAYSRGAGTYTGIEAVSNGVAIIREPRVAMGKRTMFYMAFSLATVSAGLFLGYLLAGSVPAEGKTLNAVLAADAFGRMLEGHPGLGSTLVWLTLVSETGLLFIAAQTGFIDGPRVMANMALDNWLPRRFSLLSHRLTIQNGVLLFGILALGTLLYTRGVTSTLVLMYSINVFVTFSLTQLSMVVFYLRRRGSEGRWFSKAWIHMVGLGLCATVLTIMVVEKFTGGGWLALAAMAGLLTLCAAIRRYYSGVAAKMRSIDERITNLPLHGALTKRPLNPAEPAAILLVDRYGGAGIHAIFSILRSFPGTFRNIVFVSVGIVDAGAFKGADAVEGLESHAKSELKRYEQLARRLGLAASSETAIATDVVEAASKLCQDVAKRFSSAVVFGSKLVFHQERWYHAIMHNRTNEAIQSRLQWVGLTMTILPIRVF